MFCFKGQNVVTVEEDVFQALGNRTSVAAGE
jgi:hypothetical protein